MDDFYLSEIREEFYDSIWSYRQEMLKEYSSFDGCTQLENYEDMHKWHLNALLFENADTVPPGYSIGYEYLYVKDGEVAGMINLRPEAESHPYLKRYGGHIGYSVRPSMRRQGIGTRMLADALLICKERFGLSRVMISCLEDNEGSRRVILNNGGIADTKILYPPDEKYIERYWISL